MELERTERVCYGGFERSLLGEGHVAEPATYAVLFYHDVVGELSVLREVDVEVRIKRVFLR